MKWRREVGWSIEENGGARGFFFLRYEYGSIFAMIKYRAKLMVEERQEIMTAAKSEQMKWRGFNT